jgi:DNA mismatch repair ATPase MutS
MIDTMYNIIMPDVNRKLANALPRKLDELMNSSNKYNRYVNILNKSYEAYKTKDKYVYFIIISKSNEVYLTTYEQKQLEEHVHVYDDEIINELYEIEKDIFDDEIEKITKSFFG